YSKYQITSLEKNWKPQLYVEPDLGIPLDLLDLSVYNPPKGERIPLDPEDEALLHDDDPITPIKADGIKKKDRPTDKGVSWLVKTQYISPLSMDSTKQSLTEKTSERVARVSRERKIKDIVASFEACKSKPVHAVNPQLQPKRVLPLLPDFDRVVILEIILSRFDISTKDYGFYVTSLNLSFCNEWYDDQFVVANFDSAPTADSEIYRKLSAAERDEYENRAIMKSYVSSSSDAENPYKFLAYMVPSVDEVRGDDVDDPTTYLMTFGETEAKYLPLPTKLILRKKRAREGKSGDEVEHFPVPKRVTVRRRSTAAAVELREEGDYVASKGSNRARSGRGGMDGSDGRLRRIVQDTDADNYSGAEDDMSE
ncbi:UNVERIFIED_CONTAM: protein PAF1, partial [Sesamum radiatum]